jgi:alkylation response protein AidB-like acyl-CoA dehydrogenase
MLMGDDAPLEGSVQLMALSVQSSSIAGGTDEVQRNIIGERVLGLPKER